MKKHSNGNSHLFFIEFLIVLFFFLIISTICLKLFVQACSLTRSADTLSHAQSMASSAAELLLSGAEPEQTRHFVSALFPEEDFYLEIKETASRTTAAKSSDTNSDNHCLTYFISVFDPNQVLLYELPLTLHTPIDRNTALASYIPKDQEVLQ